MVDVTGIKPGSTAVTGGEPSLQRATEVLERSWHPGQDGRVAHKGII